MSFMEVISANGRKKAFAVNPRFKRIVDCVIENTMRAARIYRIMLSSSSKPALCPIEMWDNKNGKSEEDNAKAIVNDLVNKRLENLKIPPLKFEIVSIGSRGVF
jgi:hypothetical protein